MLTRLVCRSIITCIYVLNVIESAEERAELCERIISLLDDCGTAYIAVRNDVAALNGHTSKGTWQGLVVPPKPFGLIRKTAGYCLYSHTNM